VNVPLWRDGPIDRRRASLERAELGQGVASLSVDEQKIQARRAAAHRYWVWVAAGERVRIAESLLANVLERDGALAERVTEGDLAPVERTENARVIEQRRAQLAQAERGLEQAAIELSLFLRSNAGEPSLPPRARLPKGLPEPSTTGQAAEPTADLAAALSKRPEPKKLALQVRQNEVEREYAGNQLAPAVDFQVSGSQDLGPAMPSRPDLRDPVVEVSVLIDVPLQARAMRGRRDAATATIGRLRHQERYAKDRVEADVKDAHSALRAAAGRYEAARREVRLAEELEQAERIRFEQGDSTLLIVYLREQQTAEAELRQIDGLLDYQRSLADLKAARGE
jgi:outer membrane protein TolC